MADEIKLLTPNTESHLSLFFVDGGVQAGFPSPAQDYCECRLDLNSELIQHPEATFYARVVGTSMRDAGIDPGDILVIDRSVAPFDGCMAVCCVNGEFTLKSLDLSQRHLGIIRLVPNNPEYSSITVTPEMQFEIWGVVSYTIKKRL